MASNVKHVTLVANTVATVTFDRPGQRVMVINMTGSAAIYFRTDGVDPTVKGDECWPVPASVGGSGTFKTLDNVNGASVKLISSGTPDVCIIANPDSVSNTYS